MNRYIILSLTIILANESRLLYPGPQSESFKFSGESTYVGPIINIVHKVMSMVVYMCVNSRNNDLFLKSIKMLSTNIAFTS